MTRNKKSFNLIVSVVLLFTALVSLISVTYSYFTSSASMEGDVTMGKLNVIIDYEHSGGFGTATTATPLRLKADKPIERGVAFTLTTSNNETIASMVIANGAYGTESCECYVRFWIDAYLTADLNDDGSVKDGAVNYGKYFSLMVSSAAVYRDTGKDAQGNDKSYCYYIKDALTTTATGGKNQLSLGTQMVMSDIKSTDGLTIIDAIPVDLLGESLSISISFDAVQKANEAFKDAFKVTEEDNKGYYSGWI